MDPEVLTRDLTRADKFHWPIHDLYSSVPLPLRRLYVLERSANDETWIETLRGSAAGISLCQNIFGAKCIQALGLAGHNLAHCGRLAESIEVFRYVRSWRLDRLDRSLAMLLGHLI